MRGASEERSTAVACTTEQTELGEGVRWDARRGELLRVDILAGHVYRDRVFQDGALDPVAVYRLPWPVGMVAPIHGDDGWLLGAGRGFVRLAPDGTHQAVVADVSAPGTRMNDGGADPHGRFWAGSLADDHHPGGGTFYRLDRDGRVERMLDGMTIPNGVGWSPDGRTMYLVDSGPRVVYAFDFDGERGELSHQRVLIAIDGQIGAPDGMTVDAAGDLWVAIYGAGQVQRFSSDGVLREALTVPSPQSTCCGLAGPSLNWLYVTTATEGWTDEERKADPAAGLVYRLDTGAVGRAAAAFRPDKAWWTEFQH